ncbi:CRISPR-associated protein Csn1 [Dokdonia sp. Dokd-P16]|uniref:type II CRISPR RNA-guided endonuclease Cas9 n=1 Tax=Dokdonia sp. Dokd-P16 TaxID=2173169 RepID=UPI000D547B9A|nr:type II CRISPR RNA-guided endonuclease Cas9 [Dokdonia sp. Dokd-P16]AWH75673.1 CRISPR-associated protein Csn1 [Dokdonia sp. Dokd-P16]
MKRILGLDLGTNSIGWAQINLDFKNKKGGITGIGSRIIPMDAAELGKFDSGQTISQTADRTGYRSKRRLYQRDNLRRERLHRVLNVLNFLPQHYSESIDFDKKVGQFKPDTEVKLPYRIDDNGEFHFVFQDSFNEMIEEFRFKNPTLFYARENGEETKVPYDWTIYYLRKKALTQKITKEELAWILLNFNQKRGYYQLRGEEEADKNKKFEALKVSSVIDSGQKVKGNILYDITFENGWEYDSQITKKEDWLDKTREFIVTTTTRKDGSLKRSYKKVNSEEDWLAIKEKTQNEVDVYNDKNQTYGIGSYIFDTLLNNPTQKIRGKLVKTIERKYYKDELQKILDKQIEIHQDLFTDESLKNCIEELYPRNEAHQNLLLAKDFKHLFVEDIIFYQRPLKSKKSSISDCPYEVRFYKKGEELKKQSLKCIPKSNPIFQEFRLWQFIHNLKIYEKAGDKEGMPLKDEEVTTQFLSNDDDYTSLFEKLNNSKEINQKQFLSHFKLKETTHHWNFPEDKKYPCNDTRAQIANRLSKINGVNVDSFLTSDMLQSLWHLIYSVTDKKDYEKALHTFAEKNSLSIDGFIENFKRFPPFESSYGAYSEKAIKKLLPLMRMGNHWNISNITTEVQERIDSIASRLNAVDYNVEKIEAIADDDVPMRLLKSFAKEKNKENPLKGLNTYQACYAVYNRHSEIGDVLQWKQPQDIDTYLTSFKQHSLRNPIVEKVILETLRVVRDIWTTYGEEEIINGKKQYKPLFDEIHVELGREMKNDKKTRERISKSNTERENTNERIKAILEELKSDPSVTDDIRPYSPSHQEILKIYEDGLFSSLKEVDNSIEKIRKNNKPTKGEIIKYKLWLEQGYISPYTGKIIPLTKLFSTAYQIEHVIPQSRYFDNSMNNKIICESAVNEEKDNKTAYEFLKERGGSLVDIGHGNTVQLFTIENYEKHCQTYFRKNKTKLELLLSEDIPEGFINRQLNDSRYISKVIKGLLSNIVREDGELEATSKNLIPVNGAITAKLKNDWGLNDKWNEIIAPRFKRLNELTKSQDFGYWDEKINAFRIQVPKELERNFSKKRIDHRHHALDALVIACTTRDHINYVTSLNTSRKNHKLVNKLRATKTITDNKGKTRTVAKEYHKPWEGFTAAAKTSLEKTIVSFKKNNRVMKKANNKFWSYKNEYGNVNLNKNGKPIKKLRAQIKGQNRSIRKPLHEETISGLVHLPWVKIENGKFTTATRKELDKSFSLKKIEKITDTGIQKILRNYLTQKKFEELDKNGNVVYNTEIAFTQDGIEEMNKSIKTFNNGKNHKPIYKVRIFEKGSGRFALGSKGINDKKYAQGAPNLFFNIYKNGDSKYYETVPLNEVILHQKNNTILPIKERTNVPIKNVIIIKGKETIVDFVDCLSPLDLVYIPTNEELENLEDIDFENLNIEQLKQVYNVNDFSGVTCYFTPNTLATSICPKEVDLKYDEKKKKTTGSFDTKTASLNGNSIKERFIKLNIDRLGNVAKVGI